MSSASAAALASTKWKEAGHMRGKALDQNSAAVFMPFLLRVKRKVLGAMSFSFCSE
jgi:hypothetical protein